MKYKEIAKLRAELAEYREMKPVAWMDRDGDCFNRIHECATDEDIVDLTPLYAHPPKEKDND